MSANTAVRFRGSLAKDLANPFGMGVVHARAEKDPGQGVVEIVTGAPGPGQNPPFRFVAPFRGPSGVGAMCSTKLSFWPSTNECWAASGSGLASYGTQNAISASRPIGFGHLKDFRDALAHRIPLYIPPFAVDPAVADRYQDLEVRAQAALAAGDLVTHEQLSRASRALARFSPVMVHALGETPPVVFHYQLLADASTIIEIGENVLDELAR